ncbi:MAG: glycosyltransferase [Actinomycetota bacterium]|nr:glycosyltransferase [Actinomycetota bacterium]
MNKKILFAASNYWNSIYQVGSHHYAKLFAQNGWDVLFISDPISPFHFLMRDKTQLYERYDIYKGKVKSKYENIKIYVPMAFATPNEKPVFNANFIARNWVRMTFPNLVSHIKKEGFGKVDILWFDSVLQAPLINEIHYKKSILRVADKIEGFKKISKSLINQDKFLKEKTDIIIYSAKLLEEYLKSYDSKVYYVPNGVDMSHFLNSSKDFPFDLKNIPKPIAIYIGAIDEWFGVGFLYEVISICKDISFVLIGEPKQDISKLTCLPNYYLLGRKKYDVIPGYLYNSDVGIITFDVTHPVVKTVNPIKLYEYMACGLPVVATSWEEIKSIKSPALLAKNPVEFSEKLHEALKKGKSKTYVDFAKKNTWDKRFEEIMRIYDN